MKPFLFILILLLSSGLLNGQSSDIVILDKNLENNDLVSFWNQADKLVDLWNSEAELSLNREEKESDYSKESYGTKGTRIQMNKNSIDRRAKISKEKEFQKKEALLLAITNLNKKRESGDEKIMILLVKEYSKFETGDL